MKLRILPIMLFFCAFAFTAKAQDEGTKTMDIYGHIMTDMGYNFGRSDGAWFDVMRPTKLPTRKDEYGTDGNVFFGVRQTRFGVKNYFETGMGQLKTHFEFEMFGTGSDAGQTTFRLRHAYAELGQLGVGQYWSPFMDIDVFPNSLEYWGPNAMVFFRNVQIRWMPIKGESFLTVALERPGASADQGEYAERVQDFGVSPRFAVPDLSAEYRKAFSGGYVEIAGMLRSMAWQADEGQSDELDGSAVGYGLNLSTNLKLGSKSVLRGQFVYGAGIQNYMNDAPVDIAVEEDDNGNVEGVAVPMFGALLFLDHNWNDKFSTSVGYSYLDIDNPNGQDYNAFSVGQYGLVNLLYTPAKNCLMGVELQYGARENKEELEESDPRYDNYLYDYSAVKVQFSFKYNFSQSFYKKS